MITKIKNAHTSYFSDRFKGVETVVILGDEFVGSTANNTILKMSDLYIRPRFELKIAAGDMYSNARNMMVKINNSLVQAINSCVNITKIITIMLKGDISKQFPNKSDDDTFIIMEVYVEQMMKDINKILNEFKEMLPDFSQRENWPTIIWIIPTLHRNYKSTERYHRRVLADIIEKETKKHKNCLALRLKQVWDEDNTQFFDKYTDKFTADGLTAIWQAVDRTIKYCDVIMNKKDVNMENPNCNPFKYRNPQYLKNKNKYQTTQKESGPQMSNDTVNNRHGRRTMEEPSCSTYSSSDNRQHGHQQRENTGNIRKRLFWQRDY